ncbi:hypothetical protein HPB47_016506 [Ixodes persulcatus]|uniref:Uncharacterized protein n=1 Tax=Ixodes persulcatus TaxID=34615 RepID=A0AC60R100_IXOPE|nr:hypothetical protein HPB47_016506 [Ixodes persulcatus]
MRRRDSWLYGLYKYDYCTAELLAVEVMRRLDAVTAMRGLVADGDPADPEEHLQVALAAVLQDLKTPTLAGEAMWLFCQAQGLQLNLEPNKETR